MRAGAELRPRKGARAAAAAGKMKEDICTIPINDVLAARDGCPVCTMADTLEDHLLSFILGDAMMEPDVRIETNRLGFCRRHLSMMLARPHRLALALMMESRLRHVDNTLFGKKGLRRPDPVRQARDAVGGCYVCRRVDENLERLLDTFFRLWKKEPEIREAFASQPALCLPHYAQLLEKGRAALDKKSFAVFEPAASAVLRRGLAELTEDTAGFCRMFDYHNNGGSFGDKKDAPDRAAAFFTGRRKK